jgi:4-hydroxy-tetrahydrodipicolinate synthase
VAASVEAVKGRIPVIAGIIAGSTRDAIRRGKLVRDMNVAALQVTDGAAFPGGGIVRAPK